jgi:hypothetical protein
MAPGNERRDGRNEGRSDEGRIRERGEKACEGEQESEGAKERGGKRGREGKMHVAVSDG